MLLRLNEVAKRNPGSFRSGTASAVSVALDAAAGMLIGTISVMLSTSLAALVFKGDLSYYVAAGVSLSLSSATIIGAVVALTSSYPGTIALPHDRIAPIVALMAAEIASTMPLDSPDMLPTVASAIALSTIVTGIVLLTLGTLDLGRAIRFIPYPVVGGLLAGTGWLLVVGAIGLMSGLDVRYGTIDWLFSSSVLQRWAPGALFAVSLVAATRRWPHYLVLPLMLIGGAVGFHVFSSVAGISPAEARARGWLLGDYAAAGISRFPEVLASPRIHWDVVFGEWTSIAGIAFVSAISILLNASALELDAGHDMDLDRELESAGAANLLAGLAGGLVGFHSLSISSLAIDLGRRGRIAGLVAAATCGLALLYGAHWLSFFPTAVAGGLLMSLGLGFLIDWLVDARTRLPVWDYALMVLILSLMAAVGFLQGVVAGVAAALVLFVLSYSRISVVQQVLSGAQYQSNVDRPLSHHRVLRARGDATHILRLQGFIFFGTAHRLFDQVRQRVLDARSARLRFVVLDFRRVSGFDSSALLSFLKLRRLAEHEGFRLVLTDVSERLHRQLENEGFESESSAVRVFADLDHGVEWCENEVLRAEGRRRFAQRRSYAILSRRIGRPRGASTASSTCSSAAISRQAIG